jgi:outer membrane protein assembly factor BamB
MKCLSILVCAVVVATGTCVLQAEDWPAWRGPRGDGISTELTAPLHWSPNDNIAWRTPVPGVGRSSPIVSGDRIFVTSGDESDDSRHVMCFDRVTGKMQWNVAVHKGPAGTMHRFNTTASSTPATDGELVFAAFVDDKDLRIFALDFGGNVVWSKNPGTFFSNHGFAASPVIYADGVILNAQQDGAAFLVMLSRRDGHEIWRHQPTTNLRSFSTPVLTKVGDQDQLIVTGSTKTLALNPADGKTIWFAEGPSEKFVCTPAVGHGMVFSFGGSPEKKAMAVRLGGQGDVLQTHLAWRNERSMPYIPTPILVGDYLHIMNDAGVYTCIEPQTGKTLMTGRKLGAVNSSPVSVAGRIYFFEDSGICTVVENGSGFKELAKNELGEVVYASPAVSNGHIYIRSEGSLICIGEK